MFRRVCAARGIDARAAGTPAPAEVEEPKVVRRIRKLLALAESPEPAEARSAAKQAYRLMLAHNLDVVIRLAAPVDLPSIEEFLEALSEFGQVFAGGKLESTHQLVAQTGW